MMSFSAALALLKNGRTMIRLEWDGNKVLKFLNGEILAIRLISGEWLHTQWLANQDDLLAEDWYAEEHVNPDHIKTIGSFS